MLTVNHRTPKYRQIIKFNHYVAIEYSSCYILGFLYTKLWQNQEIEQTTTDGSKLTTITNEDVLNVSVSGQKLIRKEK